MCDIDYLFSKMVNRIFFNLQGNRSKVISKKLTAEIVTSPRYIILAIFEIERSWAFAMYLKTESPKSHQRICRLRKAASRAENLCAIGDELAVLDAKTKLEIRAYKQWIQGVLYFDLSVRSYVF